MFTISLQMHMYVCMYVCMYVYKSKTGKYLCIHKVNILYNFHGETNAGGGSKSEIKYILFRLTD